MDLATRTSEGLLAMSDRGGASRINVPRSFDANGCVIGLAESLAQTRRAQQSDDDDDDDDNNKRVSISNASSSLVGTSLLASTRANAALAAHILHRFDLPATERLLGYFMCSLVETVFHTGHLYIFENHICFIG